MMSKENNWPQTFNPNFLCKLLMYITAKLRTQFNFPFTIILKTHTFAVFKYNSPYLFYLCT